MPLHFDDLAILRGDTKQLNALFHATTTAPLTLRVNTAEKFFARLFSREQLASREQLDAAFVPLLTTLKTTFVTLASQDDSFYCVETHPLRQVFECLLTRATTWYTRDSKPNEMFYEKFTNIVHLVTHWCAQSTDNTNAETAALHKALDDFKTWDDGEEKRAALVESRLCESELNHLRMLTAECHVLDLINNALAEKNLPLALRETIPTTLKNELQHCAFTAGIDSPFWRLWKRLLPLIGNVFIADKSEQDDQKMYREVPAILNELERSLQLGSSHPDSYHFFIEILSDSLILAVQKQLPVCMPLNALSYPEGHSTINTRVTDSVLQQVTNIQVGDWILFSSEENKTIRCKLALKNSGVDQLLFVDRTGRKVMIKSNKDFSLCLSTGIAKPLTNINLEDVIIKLIQALIALHNNTPAQQPMHTEANAPQKNPTATEAKTQKPELEAQAQELDEARRQDITNQVDLRRASAHKAMAEARALAADKARRASEAKQEEQAERERQQVAQEEKILQHLQLAQQQIHGLNVGAWVEILDDAEQGQRCKLAVIIASAGKYIFVDNLGRKVAEYHHAELLQALASRRLTLINNGDKFEDQLVKVIRSLRKDIS